MSSEQVRSIREIFHRVPSSHLLNQPVKEQPLIGFIERALSGLNPQPNCLELFSSDGYYSCRIKPVAPKARVTGIELDAGHIQRAETMVRRLGFENIEFYQEDVWTFLQRASEPYDLVLCAGGLYHTSDPARLLQLIERVTRTYVVIQSVITLETEDRDYFERPAPGWQHGCRFTHAWLRDRLRERNWQLTAEARTELPGNSKLRDRGSSFFLCRVV
jgi:SAM-dependent methyltransferase